MTGWILLGLLFSLLLVICLLRVGAVVRYSEGGFEVRVKIAFFERIIYPVPEGDAREKKEKTKNPKKPKQGDPEEKGGPLEQFRKYFDLAMDILRKLVGAIRIDLLQVRFVAASKDDAAKAAIMYGEAWAAEGIILAVLENNIRIKKKDIEIRVDYAAEKPSIYCRTNVSGSIGGLLWAGIRIAANYAMQKLKQNVKGGAKNGKANC